MAMVYVGSNDGRLYGFRGDIGAADSGVEQFSYIPGGVYHNLSHLTDPSYYASVLCRRQHHSGRCVPRGWLAHRSWSRA